MFSSTSSNSPSSVSVASSFLSPQTLSILKDLTAGTIAGCAGIVTGQPFDTIKTRLQSQTCVPIASSCSSAPSTSVAYRSTFDCFRRTIVREGVLKLWSGLSSPLIGAAPLNAILFACNGQMLRWMKSANWPTEGKYSRETVEYTRMCVAGSVGGFFQSFVSGPTELIKCKMQVQIDLKTKTGPTAASSSALSYGSSNGSVIHSGRPTHSSVSPPTASLPNQLSLSRAISTSTTSSPFALSASSITSSSSSLLSPPPSSSTSASSSPHYRSTFDCLRSIYRLEGIRGLYRGWLATMLRDTPSCGVYFVIYDVSKSQWKKLSGEKESSVANQLVAGGIAGAVSWLSIYPMDVCKSVIQTSPTPRSSVEAAQSRLLNVVRRNYSLHGSSWFWRGLGATMIRAVPVNAVTLCVYEQISRSWN